MNRGSVRDIVGILGRDLASMRPRFMNRGSCPIRRAWPLKWTGFNEAPIHESGKWYCTRELKIEPIASMRPRFMNRGSGRGQAFGGRADRGFNEAPIHESGKSLELCLHIGLCSVLQ